MRWKTPLRHRVARIVDKTTSKGIYGIYGVHEEEYIGRIEGTVADAIELLTDQSYAYNLLAATKLHHEDERRDDGSYRRLDPTDSAKQWHVHLWDRGEGVEVYSHYEFKPEPWNPVDLERVREHYRPTWGETYLLGQHCDQLKTVLEEHGTYEGDSSKIGSTELEP